MALARNVRVLLDGKSRVDHTLVPDGEEEITTIGSRIEHRYILNPRQAFNLFGLVSLESARIVDVLI